MVLFLLFFVHIWPGEGGLRQPGRQLEAAGEDPHGEASRGWRRPSRHGGPGEDQDAPGLQPHTIWKQHRISILVCIKSRLKTLDYVEFLVENHLERCYRQPVLRLFDAFCLVSRACLSTSTHLPIVWRATFP